MEEYDSTRMLDMESQVIPTGLPGGFFIYEAGGEERILFAEENVIRLFGCETMEEFREYTGNTFAGMVYEDDLNKIQNEIQAQTMFGEKRHDYVRYRIRTKQGEIRYIEDFGHLLHGRNGHSFFYVFIVDVDKNEFLNRSRNSLAEAQVVTMNQETDSLTGLFNMSFFYQRVQSLMDNTEARRQDFAFIHFDISNFKLYNERHGFRMGDELLCDVARTIRKEFSGGTVARFSDDHFVVCASGTAQEILPSVETIYRTLITAEDPNKRVRIKAGIYYLDDRNTEVGLSCDHARLACNSIKGRHDRYYCEYDEGLRDKLRKQQYVVDHIDEALEKEYIKVFYQPVIRVKTGEICGYEALVRWIDPKIGFLSPADFIETLEHYHLIHLVDGYVVKKVCEGYNKQKATGRTLVPVSVNLSRLDFELCDVFSMIEDARRKYDVPVNALDLEITESALNENDDGLKADCKKLKDAGYQLWLDDFGSGYSSLNTLVEYDFDVLKLDMVFMRSFDRNPKTAKLLSFIVEAANGMGLTSLCEGVETKEHYEFLKTIGCEKAQGYYFGKPAPFEDSCRESEEKGMKWEEQK